MSRIMQKEYDFVAIDFETANANPNSACSIGMAMVKDKIIVDTFYTLIQPPGNKYDAKNVTVHGIKPTDTMLSSPFIHIAPKVFEIIEASQFVIAHYSKFDMGVLYKSSNSNQTFKDFRYLDSIEISNPVSQGISGKLSERAKYFRIDNDDHHNALNDAIVCAQIVIESLKINAFTLIEHLINYPEIRIYNYSSQYQYSVFRNPNYEKVNTEALVPNDEYADDSLAGKNFVFTGEFEYGKQKLMQEVVNKGGIIKSSTVKNTNYLIVGVQDPKIVKTGISTKHRKALELIEQGSDLKILDEAQIMKLLSL